MKKKIILWCLLLILVLSSCAPDEMDETGKIEKQERLSIELPTENVVAKHEISERYVLVETQLSGNAPKFDLYDLEKGEMYNLPTMPEYVVLEEILNENNNAEESDNSSESVFKNILNEISKLPVRSEVVLIKRKNENKENENNNNDDEGNVDE